ncbi:MAG: DUF192 domain-containing protein [Acidobacteriota bacterium]
MVRARLLSADGRDLASVELATSSWTRARGLLGRSGLAPAHALWLAPCRSIHTVGMRFAIDVVFLDRDSRVVKVVPDMVARRLCWGGWRAHGALEFAGGEALRLGLAPGQTLHLRVAEGRDGGPAN